MRTASALHKSLEEFEALADWEKALWIAWYQRDDVREEWRWAQMFVLLSALGGASVKHEDFFPDLAKPARKMKAETIEQIFKGLALAMGGRVKEKKK